MRQESKNRALLSALWLFLAALIWGTAFVAQRIGADHIEGFTFTGVRNVIGALALLPFVRVASQKGFADGRQVKALSQEKRVLGLRRSEVIGGILCGAALYAASNFQQYGITLTSVGKAGFITALYVVIVPVFGVLRGKKVKPLLWVCVGGAVAGMYLLCVAAEGEVSLSLGDLLMLICAFLFAAQISLVGRFAPRSNGIALAFTQFLSCAALSLLSALLFEEISPESILSAAGPLLYVGIMSSGVAYTLQIIGQSGLSPSIASMIMCLESVVSAVAAYLVLGQALAPVEIAGCALMFAAVLLSTLFAS